MNEWPADWMKRFTIPKGGVMQTCPYDYATVTVTFGRGAVSAYLSCRRRMACATWDKFYIPIEVIANEYKRRYQAVRDRNLDMPSKEVEEIMLLQWARELWDMGLTDGDTWG